MNRNPKRKFNGEIFTLMVIRTTKKEAQEWAIDARKPPHNARARVVKGNNEWLVYVNGNRK